jgi:hypothetical protein
MMAGDDFLALIERVTAQLGSDHFEGYIDGRDGDTPAPNANRSPAYHHSWEIGRAEKDGRDPMPAVLARHHAATIRSDAIAEAMQLAGMMPRK